MTFEEKLDRARTGSHAAYESLCLGSLDKLYTAALISLKRDKEARCAVITAIRDGNAGISRIKDERHLCSWLAHGLTKYSVDKLKELKSDGVSYPAEGVFVKTGKMPDVERLVFSLYAAFGYGAREISVLTGMSESTVSEKLADAKTHLGSSYDEIISAAQSCTAPDSLRERYTGFDESLARMEREAEAAKQAEEAKQAELARAADADSNESADKSGIPDAGGEAAETAAASEVPEPGDDDAVFSEEEESLPDEQQDEYYEEDENDDSDGVFDTSDETAGSSGSEIPESQLNAATFIAVVSGERMKGSEFLRLIGNTRISNSAYREIEQNPRLTKKRLIELLEQSQLTENDYYKLLTAVKERRDVLDAKEESRLAHERAGLYDGSRREKYRRKRREKPKTELQMAIGISDSKPQQPLTFEQSKVAEDDLDYQLQNSTGTFRHPGYYRDHIVKPKEDKTSLEAVITPPEKNSPVDDPMSHAALHDLFDEHNDEPIDPFAAIAANETGRQIKPGRIDEQENEWLKAPVERKETKSSQLENTTETKEFEIVDPAPSVSDTKQFDVISGEPAAEPYTPVVNVPEYDDDDSAPEPYDPLQPETSEPAAAEPPEQEQDVSEPAAAEITEPEPQPEPEPVGEEPVVGYDPFAVNEELDNSAEEHEISTNPIHENISVTQIISDFAIGERISDEEADFHLGFAPDASLVFDAASDSMSDDDEELEFNDIGYAADKGDTIPIQIGSIGEQETEPYSPEQDTPVSISMPDFPDDDEEPDEPDEPEDTPAPAKAEPTDGSDDDDDDEDGSFDEPPARKRYKGNEYFVDDNEYYEGVNRGKIITCAVFAALLIAGSVGMKMAPAPAQPAIAEQTEVSEQVTEEEEPPISDDSSETEFSEDVTLSALGSYADMTADAYEGSSRSQPVSSRAVGYLRASAEPFSTDIVTDITNCGAVFTDYTAYIYSHGEQAFRAVPVGEQPEEPTESEAEEETDTDTDESVAEEQPVKLPVSEETLHAFTAIDGDLYIIRTPEGTEETEILVCDRNLSEKSRYILGGRYEGAAIVDGKLTAAVCFCTDEASSLAAGGKYSADHPYYITDGELHDIPASEIYAIDGAKHNSVHIVFTVGLEKPLAVLGGCYDGGTENSMRSDGYGITLVSVDEGETYAIDISKDLKIVQTKRYQGEAFSAECVGKGGMVGQITADGAAGITAYKGGKLVTVPDASAVSVAWSDSGTAYVVAELDGQKMLYGFDMSGDEPANAEIAASDIYTDKLVPAGGYLAGIKAEPTPDGERAGLRLSLYEYDGTLKETAYSVIELDKDTPRENLKYLSSPAEQDTELLAVSEDGSMFAVPTVYFDGYSEVERVVLLSYNGTIFTQAGEHITYDEKSSVLCPVIRDGKLYIITDTKTEITDTESPTTDE